MLVVVIASSHWSSLGSESRRLARRLLSSGINEPAEISALNTLIVTSHKVRLFHDWAGPTGNAIAAPVQGSICPPIKEFA